ncbi:hypothetical protein MKW98_029384 [Papaver atlanticum]|uniref:Protein kinase domain-containing protein n=1 Tax=Papaver atlanticum TaxID=357466 RepID=A0AAD4XFS8_9MAGN|nr:hypothetical protein MKW98_029384 [Papaver atlanticum]
MSKTPSNPYQIFKSYPSCVLLLLLFFNVTVASDEEQSILLKLKQQWNHPPSLDSWKTSSSSSSSSSAHCEDWEGISCDENNSVTSISLSDKNITEKIPSFLCDLKNLTEIDFSWNYIPGNFPDFLLQNCTNLVKLDLSQNYLVGQIPSDIDRFLVLEDLNLGGNNFTGDIPKSIGKISGLKKLYLHQNLLDGLIPGEIGNLSNLEFLGLAYNPFSEWKIPLGFGKLKKLKEFWAADVKLIGEIPETVDDLIDLEIFDLSTNQLDGKIPDQLFLLKNLTSLYLYDNKLSGEIPVKMECLNLVDIDLSMNQLTGTLPHDLGKLKKLVHLLLYRNQLSGEVPASIGKLPSLKQIRLFTNKLNGSLPEDMGLFAKLEALEVAENELTGNLPGNLCAGGELIGISVYTNNLSGGVSKVLEKCNSLNVFQLYSNRFSGEFPAGIWSLTNLSRLMISDNLFTGSLPDEFAANLTRVEISNNMFSGGIPKEMSQSMSLTVFKAKNNRLSGEIPGELTGLSKLLTLSLEGNQLSGPIPSHIISWSALTFLNLSGNQLSGEIPEAIGQLPSLIELDLSENLLSGEIPLEIGQLHPTFLNLSSNRLTGKIPFQIDNFAFDKSFLNNSGLCGHNLEPVVPSCISKPYQNSNKSSSKVLIVVLIITAVICLGVVSFGLFAFRDYRRKRNERDISTWKLTSFHRLQFTESDILSSLTENNMIGSGGSGKVYRVDISGIEESVAVKKIYNQGKLNKQLEKEFQAEVQILGTIRHLNIVKLLCCVACDNSMLLVYEYMENRSLDQWLHAKKRGFSNSGSARRAALDWPTRLQIAIGAAQGLCYMHDSCSPAIIHRDVKSSNILLDHEFRAKIADFGLAKLLAKHGEPQTMSAMAGSFGYFAPEYGYTRKVNEKVDVYSFGVVLLELATGKEANRADEHTGLVEWARCQFDEGKSIIDAFDEEIKEPCYLDEISSVFKLGLVCTGTSPSTRPTMSEVLEILLQCGPQQGFHGVKNTMKTEEDVNPLLVDERNLFNHKGSKGSRRSVRHSDDCDDSLVCNNV